MHDAYRRASLLSLLDPDDHPLVTVSPPDLLGSLPDEAGRAALNAWYIGHYASLLPEDDDRRASAMRAVAGEHRIISQIAELMAYRMRANAAVAANLG
jgi:hypothetical protein